MEYIDTLYSDSMAWERKLVSLNHFLSIVIEQLEKKGVDCSTLIDLIYSQENYCNFKIQENEIRFLESLFKNESNSNLSLEDELIAAQNRIER